MMPPSASTSRTTVPFATPPIAGLHDIWPIVSSALVTMATRAPDRAAQTAASVPACPAPTTMTSKVDSYWVEIRAAAMPESYGIFRADPIESGARMALTVATGAPTLFIRREAYEKSGLTRQSIDERLGLTPDEFRVEGKLIALGPIYGDEGDALGALISELEGIGLVYFDDFFELTGNWPDWLNLLATSA